MTFPGKKCDLVMRGGIASGVVYPGVVVRIAKDYMLQRIGGTSAGAIAATVAAAAEYRRQCGDGDTGFDHIARMPDDLAQNLASLIQPDWAVADIWSVLSDGKSKGTWLGWLGAVLRYWWPYPLAALGLALGLAYHFGDPLRNMFLPVLALFVIFFVLLLTGRLVFLFLRQLPKRDFGLISGMGQRAGKPGLTEWLADQIDITAGNLGADGRPGPPLTVGQLREKGITLVSITTDLSSGRPYQLPLADKLHSFRLREFQALFPPRVLDYMVTAVGKTPDSDLDDPYYYLPSGDAFPVILVARMSLSFPLLFRAVPLYRMDRLMRPRPQLARLLFSDGGITSNFPIHFFDAILPKVPTFGISLATHKPHYHGETRVAVGGIHPQSTNLPVAPHWTTMQFLGSILRTARNWQDTLQSTLPSYPMRIVEIRLDEKTEGGMNFRMPDDTIRRLSRYGTEGAELLLKTFDFDEHRWVRAMTVLPRLEAELATLAKVWSMAPTETCTSNYQSFLSEYNTLTPRYGFPNARSLNNFTQVVRAMASVVETPDTPRLTGSPYPSHDGRFRLIASTHRVPRSAADKAGDPDPI